MANSADPDHLASSEANWSGSTLFTKAGYIRVQQDKGSWRLCHIFSDFLYKSIYCGHSFYYLNKFLSNHMLWYSFELPQLEAVQMSTHNITFIKK